MICSVNFYQLPKKKKERKKLLVTQNYFTRVVLYISDIINFSRRNMYMQWCFRSFIPDILNVAISGIPCEHTHLPSALSIFLFWNNSSSNRF